MRDVTLPRLDSAMSPPVSEWSATSPLLTAPVRMSLPRTLLFLMSFDLTVLFLMSPESTLFVPGSAIAVPDNAASSATNATTIAGDGWRRSEPLVAPPLVVVELALLAARITPRATLSVQPTTDRDSGGHGVQPRPFSDLSAAIKRPVKLDPQIRGLNRRPVRARCRSPPALHLLPSRLRSSAVRAHDS